MTKPTKTHIELEFDTPIIWPMAALELLEEQLKRQVQDQLRNKPEERLTPLVHDALDDLFIGLRSLDGEAEEVIVRKQTIELRAYVIETRKGKAVRKRRLNSVQSVEIVWPFRERG